MPLVLDTSCKLACLTCGHRPLGTSPPLHWCCQSLSCCCMTLAGHHADQLHVCSSTLLLAHHQERCIGAPSITHTAGWCTRKLHAVGAPTKGGALYRYTSAVLKSYQVRTTSVPLLWCTNAFPTAVVPYQTTPANF